MSPEQLILHIATLFVDNADAVSIETESHEMQVVFSVSIASTDLVKVKGSNAEALRIILIGMGAKQRKRYRLCIVAKQLTA